MFNPKREMFRHSRYPWLNNLSLSLYANKPNHLLLCQCCVDQTQIEGLKEILQVKKLKALKATCEGRYCKEQAVWSVSLIPMTELEMINYLEDGLL